MTRHVVLRTFLFVCLAARCARNSRSDRQDRFISFKPTPKTVTWGYYDPKTPPVLRIQSGDTVEIQTLIASSPERFESARVPPDQIEQPLRDIFNQVKEKGPGAHVLTGPIYNRGSREG